MPTKFVVVSFWKIVGINTETSDSICSLLSLKFSKSIVIFNHFDEQLVITEVVSAFSDNDAQTNSIAHCIKTLQTVLQIVTPSPTKVVCKKIAEITNQPKPQELHDSIDELFTLYTADTIQPNQN